MVLFQELGGDPQGGSCPHGQFPAAGVGLARRCSVVLVEYGDGEEERLPADKSIFGLDCTEGLKLCCPGVALMALVVMLSKRVGLGH